jgi:hypothetical protein
MQDHDHNNASQLSTSDRQLKSVVDKLHVTETRKFALLVAYCRVGVHGHRGIRSP